MLFQARFSPAYWLIVGHDNSLLSKSRYSRASTHVRKRLVVALCQRRGLSHGCFASRLRACQKDAKYNRRMVSAHRRRRLRGSGRNNFRQHLHLRRSPSPIASPPARTHHRPTRCSVRFRPRNQPPHCFIILGRSIDRASRSRHSKFKPAVLGEIQAAGEMMNNEST
jgi:hypothetical protein